MFSPKSLRRIASTALGLFLGILACLSGSSPASAATDSTNAAVMSAAAFVKSTAAPWAAGTGNGGMGNGLTITAATWYHVCMANNTGVPDYYFDTSVSCANRPAGIADTKVRRISSFRTQAASTNIELFFQYGDEFVWKTPQNNVNAGTLTAATPAAETLSVPPGVNSVAHFRAYSTATPSPAADFTFYTPAATGTSQGGGNVDCSLASNSLGSASCHASVVTDTSRQVEVVTGVTNTSNFYLNTIGWRDFRGQQ